MIFTIIILWNRFYSLHVYIVEICEIEKLVIVHKCFVWAIAIKVKLYQREMLTWLLQAKSIHRKDQSNTHELIGKSFQLWSLS
jgi:hypothetical protein